MLCRQRPATTTTTTEHENIEDIQPMDVYRSLLPRCRTRHQDYDDVCDVCTAHAKMQKQISDVEAQLRELKEQERILRSKLNEAHDPLHVMPPEIVSRIFECIRSPDEDSSISPYLTIGAICHRWRKIAWSTPSLWNVLDIIIHPNYDGTFDSRIAIFKDCLSRSGTLPLTVTASADFPDGQWHNPWDGSPSYPSHARQLGEILQRPDVSSRMQFARLPLLYTLIGRISRTTAPSLKTLLLKSSDKRPSSGHNADLESLTSNVENLTLQMVDSGCVRLSYQSLTSLTLEKCTPSLCIRILSDAPVLRSCTTTIWPERAFPSSIGIDPVLRKQLVELNLSYGGNSGTCTILDFFTFPGLEVLVLAMDPDDDGDINAHQLESFLARSQCPLTELCLCSNLCPWSLSDIQNTLSFLPKLTNLQLDAISNFRSLREVFELVFAGAESPNSPWPRLIDDFQCSHFWSSTDSLDNWSFIPELFDCNQRPKCIALHLLVPHGQKDCWGFPRKVADFIQDLEALGWSFDLIIDVETS